MPIQLLDPGRRRSKTSLSSYVLWPLAVFAAAFVGSQFMPGEWYAALNKPAWTPPGAAFAIVWPILYVLMAISAVRLARAQASPKRRTALVLMAVQLVFNGLWSWLFFGLELPGVALIDIALLWLTLVALIVTAASVDRIASYLLVPYLLWVTFATLLNGSIVLMN